MGDNDIVAAATKRAPSRRYMSSAPEDDHGYTLNEDYCSATAGWMRKKYSMETLAAAIRQVQFRDIRPKAASDIDDLGRASKLLGHTDKRITETVDHRVGEVVDPTR